jgi:branched-chain amino acid transport system ATP-binding protein
MTASTPLLETRDLTIRFGAVVAVDRISVAIHEREVVGLIGTNGAGKTTFINMVTGYLPPSAGTIQLDGRDVTGTDPRKMVAHGVARSFQVPQLFPEMTVLDHVVTALALGGQRKTGLLSRLHSTQRVAAARETLNRFGLSPIESRPVSLVPQGQRKLIDIAMALALEPKLLFLDEPTSGVSSSEKIPLMEVVFSAIRERGVTVLFVEHDMEIVSRYVTRLMAFRDGRLIADGTPRDVMAHEEVSTAVLRRKREAVTA